MVIISVNSKSKFRGYGNTQFHYAMTYVVITFVVLLILNFYCSRVSQMLFYQSKEASMIEKCQLASDEIAAAEVLNPSTVSGIISQIESLKVSRMIITDHQAVCLYDSQQSAVGSYVLLPEILQALGRNELGNEGNDVFSWKYKNSVMESRAATPITYYGTIIGCVYITEYDPSQGALIHSLQSTVLQVTLILEIIVVLFSIAFSSTFSRRLRKIMTSMRIIQEGDYSHKVIMDGNDELTMLSNEFNDLTERLNTSEQKRRRFVSDASHELKTPLASIKLLTDSILQNDMDPETIREFVGDIGNEAERLNRMTAKLLSLTKVDGQITEEAEIIYLSPTVRRVHRMLSPLAGQAGVSIELSLEEDCPVLILEDDLYQVIFNLMENGIKYNQPGGNLSVTLRHQNDNAILIVQDTGMGIPSDSLPHIFERFYRVDKARSRASGGSGLGLAIVRAIVVRNRGDIQVHSTPGEGTCFTVTFPSFETEVDKE
ncbi:MAG: sensor histidine kinase [Faecousia sp.]